MNRSSFLLSASGVVAHPLLRSLAPSSSGLLYAAQQSACQEERGEECARQSRRSPSRTTRLTIQPCTIEISPGVNIKTLAYNGQVPGPMLRLRQGVPVTIDVTNTTGNEDIVHWHGLTTDPLNDGAMEEGSPMIPAGRPPALHPRIAQPRGNALVSHPCHRGREPRASAPTPASSASCWWKAPRRSRPLRPGGLSGHPPLAAVLRSHGGDHAGRIGQPSRNLRLRRWLPVRHHQSSTAWARASRCA